MVLMCTVDDETWDSNALLVTDFGWKGGGFLIIKLVKGTGNSYSRLLAL